MFLLLPKIAQLKDTHRHERVKCAAAPKKIALGNLKHYKMNGNLWAHMAQVQDAQAKAREIRECN